MTSGLLPFLLLTAGLGLGAAAGLSHEDASSSSPAAAESRANLQEMPEPPSAPIWSPTEAIELDFDGVPGKLRLLTPSPDVGLPIRFTLELDDESPGTAPGPMWPAAGTTLGEFEVIGVDDEVDGSRWPSWSIRTFASGLVELPSFTIEWNGVDSPTPPRRLEIASAAGLDTAPDAFRDIAQAVDVPLPRPWLAFWIVGGAFILLTLLIMIVLLRRRDRGPAPDPAVPADIWALARLDELAAEDLLQRRRIHAFYLRLTDITRGFIERRYGIAAPDRTTPEASRELERHPLVDAGHAEFLRRLLRSADLVKFAGDRPSPGEADRDLKLVRDFVREVGAAPPTVQAQEPDAGQGGDAGAPAALSRPGPATDDTTARDRTRAVQAAVDGLDELEDRS